ncbi:MAG: hypothetical protein K2V38_11640, partial [Gemmataceae bacterium]|nr:hypothetical protein [Gemmataceae bacterium]
LGRSDVAGALRALTLGSNTIREGGLTALVKGGGLRRLERLVLGGYGSNHNDVRAADVAALAASPVAAGLTDFDLSGNVYLGSAGARVLAEVASLGRLERLGLARCNIHTDGAVALAASPHLRSLRSLDLMNNGITSAVGHALASGTWMATLVRLYLARNAIGKATAHFLACPRLGEEGNRVPPDVRQKLKDKLGDRVRF